MSTLLAEAIAQLHLKPGQSYRTTVDGHIVDIRMHDASNFYPEQQDPSQFAGMVMLDPWFDAPEPPEAFTMRAHPGPIDLPDVPLMPADDEVEA